MDCNSSSLRGMSHVLTTLQWRLFLQETEHCSSERPESGCILARIHPTCWRLESTKSNTCITDMHACEHYTFKYTIMLTFSSLSCGAEEKHAPLQVAVTTRPPYKSGS